ncbi:hypothetical protein FH972_026127 [Carpinus fangiana]|uniref:N-acetyltransferase domain-containing protein n=1 Tax=Carpinus fangiana TaxID=176857 RepID=A0A5N6L317_9ROSI|nr:hypothetical protein FH972_026127 [Carpinus fangiana]
MPVNLEQERDDLEDMEPLAPEDELPTYRSNASHAQELLAHIMGEDPDGFDRGDINNDVPESLKALHPYAVTLGLSNLESCLKLEQATFPPELAGTREKFEYRLSKASELCFGLFTSADSSSADIHAETAATANPVNSHEPARKGILLGHIIATKSANELVQDEDMKLGNHNEAGRTLAVHSLAVLPDYQKRGIGRVLMKAYVQRMNESKIADRISILAFERLVPFYESLGFENRGKGGSRYGGEDWVNMVCTFPKSPPVQYGR